MKTFIPTATLAACAFAAGAWLPTSGRAATPPAADAVILSRYRELFVDDHIVAHTENLQRRWHTPSRHLAGAVLPAPHRPAWEEGGVFLRNAPVWVPEEHLYKVWYTCFVRDYPAPGFDAQAVPPQFAIAVSADGIHWTRP